MSDDLLREATRALKDAADAPTDAASFTRARVLRDVHRAERRRVSRTLVLVPAAAILLGATAALATSGGLSGAWDKVVSVVIGERLSGGEEGASELERGPEGRRPEAPTTTKADTNAPEPSVAAEAPESEPTTSERAALPEVAPDPTASAPKSSGARAAEAPSPNGGSAAVGSSPASTTATADAAANAAEERELSLYRRAHRAHFGDRDYATALGAWDDYLREVPRGRFATEAAYNRALCLARLGRSAEAEQALRPFAEGRYGGYRRQEAAQLIEALTGGSTSTPAEPAKP